MLIDYRYTPYALVKRLVYLKHIIRFCIDKVHTRKTIRLELQRWIIDNEMELSNEYYSIKPLSSAIVDRYITLAIRLGLLTLIGSKITITRYGKLLYLLKESIADNAGITTKELLFFAYLLFEKDSDLMLSILESFRGVSTKVRIKDIYGFLSENYLLKLNAKLKLSKFDKIKIEILKAKRTFIKKSGYNANSISSRVHFLLDLNFLWKDGGYYLTESGEDVINKIPILAAIETGANRDILNIDSVWLRTMFFKTVTPLTTEDRYRYERQYTLWGNRSEKEQTDILDNVLQKLFSKFKTPTAIDFLRLDISTLYVCINSSIDYYTPLDYSELRKFLKEMPILGNYRYTITEMSRPNESYIRRAKISI